MLLSLFDGSAEVSPSGLVRSVEIKNYCCQYQKNWLYFENLLNLKLLLLATSPATPTQIYSSKLMLIRQKLYNNLDDNAADAAVAGVFGERDVADWKIGDVVESVDWRRRMSDDENAGDLYLKSLVIRLKR